jgi:hypothetical protein
MNQRMINVVMGPASALATFPAKIVNACLGMRYWGNTEKNSLNTLDTWDKNNRKL